MHFRAVATVAVLAALTTTSAWASAPHSASPAPAASATTYLPNGTALPVSPVTAVWSHVVPGCAGQLDASGPVVSGTTTVARGEFLSRVFRPRGGRLVTLSIEQGGRRVAQPMPEGFAMAFRVRAVGHHWSPWWSLHGIVLPGTLQALPQVPLFVTQVGASLGVIEAPQRG